MTMKTQLLQCDVPDISSDWKLVTFYEFIRNEIEPYVREVEVDLLILPPHFGTLAALALLRDKPSTFPEFLQRVPEVHKDANSLWLEAASHLGRRAKTIVAGTGFVEDSGNVYHEARVMENHEVIGIQRQTHRYGREKDWPLERSQVLEPIDSAVGRLGILTGSDVIYPETARILSLQGADILVSLFPAPRPYPETKQWARFWSHVQSNQVCGLETGLGGQLLDVRFEGRAAAITVCDLTVDASGYLARLEGPGQLQAECNLEAIKRVREEYPVLELANQELYRRESAGLLFRTRNT